MVLLILEALGAMALLLFIVWWTMFSGRRRGERAAAADLAQGDRPPLPGPPAADPSGLPPEPPR